MKEYINVLVCRVNQEPRLECIPNTEEGYKSIVKSQYQFFMNPFSMACTCISLDGKEKGFPFNKKIGEQEVYGDFFVTSYGENSLGDFRQEHAIMYSDLITDKNAFYKVVAGASKFRPYKIYNEKQTELFEKIRLLLEKGEFFPEYIDVFEEDECENMFEPLSAMHKAFIKTYGTDSIDELIKKDEAYIDVPAIIESVGKKKFYIGILTFNLFEDGEVADITILQNNEIFVLSQDCSKDDVKSFLGEIPAIRYWVTPHYNMKPRDREEVALPVIRKVISKVRGTENN